MAQNHFFTQHIWQSTPVRTVRHLFSAQRVYRRLTASKRRLPDYIIAGAQKSGTTSLWAYLAEHPDVDPPMTKEMHFFDVNFHRGLNWYRMFFPFAPTSACASGDGRLSGESSAYYMFHPLAAARIRETLPKAKIILLLREPVSRAFSHYQLKIRRRQEMLSFEDAIAAEAGRLAGEHEKILANPTYHSLAHDRFSYLARGVYVDQIRRWQSHFPPQQLLILESGEFFQHTARVYERVLDFLDLPRWQPKRFGNRFPGNYREKIDDATAQRLAEYFAPHNEALYQRLGTRFDWDRKWQMQRVA